MLTPSIQHLYSAIVVRGRRNAPTFSEVKRDSATLIAQAEAAVMDSRF